MTTRFLTAAIAAATLAGGGWYLAATQPGLSPVGAAMAQDAHSGGDMATGGDADAIDDIALGDADAPVTIIEYASFTCPHCARFHETVFPDLKADYIDTGQVRFVTREVYFDAYGLWAGLLARCGSDEERYYAIVDMIYERQSDWTSGEPAEVGDNLRRIGRLAGMDNAQIDACLQDEATAEAMVARYQQNMAEYDVSGTPSFVINGELHSNMGYADMAEIIDGHLEE
ncbi:thiol-disulfide oxidoreductase [Rhodobacteraceae bacterium WD3A24]|nr:thiol-disulfide oxidoreductase [Rhodobacteraceae bacterium WD3A24]